MQVTNRRTSPLPFQENTLVASVFDVPALGPRTRIVVATFVRFDDAVVTSLNVVVEDDSHSFRYRVFHDFRCTLLEDIGPTKPCFHQQHRHALTLIDSVLPAIALHYRDRRPASL